MNVPEEHREAVVAEISAELVDLGSAIGLDDAMAAARAAYARGYRQALEEPEKPEPAPN